MKQGLLKLDTDELFKVIEYRDALMYYYDTDGGEDEFYQRTLDEGIVSDDYYKYEQNLLRFLLKLYDEEKNVKAIIGKIDLRHNRPLKSCKDYLKRIKTFAPKCDADITVIESREEMEVAAILAAREITSAIFKFENKKLVIWTTDLHGLMMFETDKNASSVLEMAQNCGLNYSQWQKKYFNDFGQMKQWLSEEGTISFIYKDRHYYICYEDEKIEFTSWNSYWEEPGREDRREKYGSINDVDNINIEGERLVDLFDKIDVMY